MYNGFIDIGEMSAILQLVNQIQGPLSSLSGFLPSFYAAVASAERLMEFENLPDEKTSGEKIDDINDFYSRLDSIKVSNVTFSYGRDAVLENASCEIHKGDFVAVTGISGIGKSTLFKLMMGVLTPQNGEYPFAVTVITLLQAVKPASCFLMCLREISFFRARFMKT